jgi:hypothetical protein
MGLIDLRILFAAAAAVSTWLAVGEAQAANGAYAVDAADISDAGSCKVESWLSTAANTDFSAFANPSCVVDVFRPVELSLLTNRAHSDGDWSTTIAPKAKTNLAPTGIGKFGFSFYAGGAFDALTGENLAVFAVVPATYRLSETMRINLNGGWLWDRTVDRHYLAYGLVSTGSSPTSCNGPSRHSARPAPPIFRARFGRGFKPACATGPTRFSRLMSSTAAISPAKTPTGSR